MKTVDGVYSNITTDCAIFHISDLTDDIKELLRNQLISICYGKSGIISTYDTYNYTNTLDEFIKRYENKNINIKKGMIGELLSHMLITYYFDQYDVISPFFNKEERSIKKGFDVLLYEKSNFSVWFTEVKSGEPLKNKNSDQTTFSLLGKANRDLINRLSDNDNRSLWLNAINDARLAYENDIDEKKVVIKILDCYASDTNKNNKFNVFLVSALFAPLSNPISTRGIQSKSKEIQRDSKFNKIFILSLQKGTYIKVYEFLKKESKNEQ